MFLYGSSLGGYCALYYAGAVNGVAIAAGPRNSFHPILIGKEKSKDVYKHEDIINNPVSKKYMLVIIDPNHESDKFFLEQVILPAYPNIKLIELPDVGHEVLYHINYTKQLRRLILDIVYENYTDVFIDKNIESPYQYRVSSFKSFNERNYRKAIYFAALVLDKDESSSLDSQMLSVIKKSLNKIVL